ncbi:NLP/P60 protein [Mycobacteroides abscessus subsp. massiliense]|uniref:C40 family peptidase n=1 Tax=Mycobacteroides abscessus TaxID=36809 RepID=UPI0009A8A52E|nr:NlpC/P60 family protein [Mycobacteroides abscessus]SKH55051.1 NLP/P60 protein [Mycobacteroides abscessus subsp. massiliense]SKH85625.1 NLP/P60 protein [Mycobacteroides abscessus subsp. massiliense]SKK32514.1 NLP/P60 protein [Mycobacteroides abscessus subsp. massiliense]SKK47271.1 NLP/P60 protein [Mycobacteroides abscessus subsp. massiliense]SKL88442.1 NLP/P60 protein [Mycobacteroides abscessus subsp. massiliense]
MAKCSDIEHWSDEGLRNVIGTMDNIHKSQMKLGDTLEGVQANLSSWGGLTAEAWHRYHGKVRVDVDEHGHQAKAVADKLRPLYDEVLSIKSQYRYLKSTIVNNGHFDKNGDMQHWKLRDDGTIDTGGSTASPQEASAKQDLEGQMKALLRKADGVDAEIADALKAITTPGGGVANGPQPGQSVPKPEDTHKPDPTIAASADTPADQLPLMPKDGHPASPTMGTANNASPDPSQRLNLGYKASIAPLLAGRSAEEWRQRLANYKPGDALPDPRTPTGDRSIDAIANAAGQQGSSYAWGGNRNIDGPSPGTLKWDIGNGAHDNADDKRIGYDCGGLVRYSVGQATPGFNANGTPLDVGLGTDAIDSNHNLTRINENGRIPSTGINNSQAGAGDVLVFGGKASGTDHTGLYLGNGFFINAPGSGMPVQIDDLRNRTPDYADVLRIPAP